MSQAVKCPLCDEPLSSASVGSVAICAACGMSSRISTSASGATVAEEVPRPPGEPAEVRFQLFIGWGLAITMIGTSGVLFLVFVLLHR